MHMRTRTFILVAVAIFASLVGGFLYVAIGGGGDERRLGASLPYSYTSGSYGLSIDGAHAGYLSSMSCGAVEAQTSAGLEGKTDVAPRKFEPCEISIALPLEKPVANWVAGLLEGKNPRKDLVLSAYDLNLKEKTRLEVTEALLTEFSLPAFEPGGKDVAKMTLKFQPGSVRADKGSDATGPPRTTAKQWGAGQFKFDLGEGQLTKVGSISAWSVEWNAEQARALLGDLTITVGTSDPRLVDLDDLLRMLIAGEYKQTTARISLLDPTLLTTLGTIDFTSVGMKRGELFGSKVVAGADAPASRRYTFYVGGATLRLG